MKRLVWISVAIFSLISVLLGATQPTGNTLRGFTNLVAFLQFQSAEIPEPASIILLSLVILSCTTVLRRHRLNRQS